MSDSVSPPTSLPSPATPPPAKSFGEEPDDRTELRGITDVLEAILRHPRRIVYHLTRPGAGKLIAALLMMTVLCSLIYGVIIGSFSGNTQLWAAPIKLSLGLCFAALICLPSLYIFACLGGSQAKIVEVFGLLSGLLTLTTLLLIGLAPMAWIFSRSIDSIVGIGVMHLLFWLISVGFGLGFLRRGFRLLGICSTTGINVWVLVFLLVSLQVSTALRPLIGTSDHLLAKEKKFFLVHWANCMNAPGGSGQRSSAESTRAAPPSLGAQ